MEFVYCPLDRHGTSRIGRRADKNLEAILPEDDRSLLMAKDFPVYFGPFLVAGRDHKLGTPVGLSA